MIKDIVYTRKYTDQKGQERKEYITVGYIFEKDGKTSILMKPWINVSALSNDKGEVWLGVYDHKTREQKQQTNTKEETVMPAKETESKVVLEGTEYAKKWAEVAKGTPGEEDDSVPF